MSSGGASELRKRQDSTSLKQGQKKRRKTKASSANTTATSPVSLASDVGHVGTQGASESREKARAHSKKLFNSMIARPELSMSTILLRGMSVQKKISATKRGYLSDVTENNSEGGHRTATSYSNLPCTC